MILLADSGSTKVHWCLVTASGQCSDVFTDGINPLFQTTIAMQNSICNQLLPQISSLLWAGTLTHVFFYGAGCTPEKKVFVQRALEQVFKKAEVSVESDMLGAARGLLGHHSGVACILGTGSGSCFYDGEKIDWCVPSLGYILGDEGSAAVLGKRLVGDLLKNRLRQAARRRPAEKSVGRRPQRDVLRRIRDLHGGYHREGLSPALPQPLLGEAL